MSSGPVREAIEADLLRQEEKPKVGTDMIVEVKEDGALAQSVRRVSRIGTVETDSYNSV
jgi:hypothetical protein